MNKLFNLIFLVTIISTPAISFTANVANEASLKWLKKWKKDCAYLGRMRTDNTSPNQINGSQKQALPKKRKSTKPNYGEVFYFSEEDEE